MPRGIGYGNSSGRRPNYQFAQPNIEQYESFFNPVPIDFLQQQVGQRQQGYNAAFAGTLAAKDELSQVQVGMADLAKKNEIIQKGIGDIDKLVGEKYGGDWSRASKEIARNITQMRANPFWNAQKEVEKRREEARGLKREFGPDALVFNDPSNLSTLTQQGDLRDITSFEPDIVKKGDWAKTALGIVSSVTANTKPIGLSQADFDLIQNEKVTEISEAGVELIANDPNVQNLLRGEHQEFDRAFDELPAGRKESLFFGAESKSEAAANILRGALRPAISKQTTLAYRENPSIDNARQAAGDNTSNPYFGSANYQSVMSTDAGNRLDDHRKKIKEPSKAGTGAPTAGGPLGTIPVLNDNMTAEEREIEQQRALNTREEYLNGYYQELVTEFPELGDLSREKGFKIYDDYLVRASESARLSWNTRLEDSSKNIKTQLISNLNNGNFSSPDVEKATGDVFDKNNFAEKMGYKDYEEFIEAVNNEEIDTKINITEGRVSADVKKKSKRGKSDKVVTINFTTDVQTQDMLNSSQAVSEAFYNPTSYAEGDMEPVHILDYKGDPTGEAVYVEGEGSIIKGNEKTLWLVDFKTKTRRPISLEQYQEKVAGHIDTRFNNYEGLIGNPGKIK